MKKRVDGSAGPSFPEIEHEKYVVPGSSERGLQRTIVEERGLRSFIRREYDDPRITVAEISLNGADPIDVFNVLLLNANQVLAEGGERDFSTALAEAQERANEFREEPLPPGFVEAAALKCWQEGIANRHGYLSPQATAATFLIIADQLREKVGANEAILSSIFALCEAWHWFHMEATGEHALAYAGAKSRRGLAAGTPTKRARRAAKDLVLEEEYGLFLEHENRKDRRTNAVFVAGAIKDAVNERLEMVHLEPYTEGSLRKALGPIIKKHRQAH